MFSISCALPLALVSGGCSFASSANLSFLFCDITYAPRPDAINRYTVKPNRPKEIVFWAKSASFVKPAISLAFTMCNQLIKTVQRLLQKLQARSTLRRTEIGTSSKKSTTIEQMATVCCSRYLAPVARRYVCARLISSGELLLVKKTYN